MIKKSLSTHGQQKPVVAMGDGKVIAGNGTLEAARALGWERLAVVTYDDEDSAKAAAYAIVDNRSTDLSSWDLETLATSLGELPSAADLGFDRAFFLDLERQLERLSPAPKEPDAPPTCASHAG